MFKLNISQASEIVKSIKTTVQNQLTKEFNKRSTGLRLQTFLHVFTIILCQMNKITLESLALKCQELQTGLSLTKQALQKRLFQGKKALSILLSDVITQTLNARTDTPAAVAVFEKFTSVNVTDATTLSLPDKLEKYHKGLGGTNAKSALKIQTTYDVKGKRLRKTEIRDNATESDATYMKELIKEMCPNELYISDLGYYGVDIFKKIAQKAAYFISRIKSNTVIYAENGTPLDLERELKRSNRIDKTVVIKGDGGKSSMTVRLCGVKLPEAVYSERLRKANKKAKSSAKVLSKDEKERLKWILIITNIPADMLDCEAVCEIYRIRWQIEIIFKSWKSHFKIDEMNNVGKDYLDCLIYGKLIVITMLNALYAKLYFLVLQTNQRHISFLRFMKNIRECLNILSDFFNRVSHSELLEESLQRIIRASLLDRRKRKTTEQIIAQFHIPCETLEFIDDIVA